MTALYVPGHSEQEGRVQHHSDTACKPPYRVFSLGQATIDDVSPVNLQPDQLPNTKLVSTPESTDRYLRSNVASFVLDKKMTFVSYFERLLEVDDDPTFEPVQDDLLTALVDVERMLTCEAQLLGCILNESNSMNRLYMLVLWCWFMAKLGQQEQVIRIMGLAHDVGDWMAQSPKDPGMSQFDRFFKGYDFSVDLNHKWAVTIHHCRNLAKNRSRDWEKDMSIC
jgi:hypothetical protein